MDIHFFCGETDDSGTQPHAQTQGERTHVNQKLCRQLARKQEKRYTGDISGGSLASCVIRTDVHENMVNIVSELFGLMTYITLKKQTLNQNLYVLHR